MTSRAERNGKQNKQKLRIHNLWEFVTPLLLLLLLLRGGN